MMADGFDCDVLIVGAGPSGLALATELNLRGHRSILIERNERTGVQPRAKTTNVRSMTQMRRWGLAGAVRRNSSLTPDFPRDVSFTTRLFAPPVFVFHDAFCASPVRRDEFPEHAEFIPQYLVEGILADHVRSAPLCDLRFRARMVALDQDARGVTARVEGPDGTNYALRARYVAGADGARSPTRQSLGIAMQGRHEILRFTSLILRIPGLAGAPGLKQALFHWILDPAAACIIGPMDRDDLWFWGGQATPETPLEPLLDTVHRAIGRNLPVEVVARDNWVVHSLLAESYRCGRIFLLGDACHLHSPFGGHGMNLGIGDAVDLGWKLSAALDGWGDDTLLDSYEAERRQAHAAVIDSATRNAASLSETFADPLLMQTGPEAETARAAAAEAIERLKGPEFRSLGLVLGYRYAGSPALIAEDGTAPPLIEGEYRPTARPGHLLPHAWLGDGASLYDRLGPGFTLLCLGPDGVDEGGIVALTDRAVAMRIPLTVIAPDDDADAAALRDLMQARLVLVRPDQHVAWRGDRLPDSARLTDAMQGRHAAAPLSQSA